ncbi:MAG: sigma-70 family RNA polymerase sigma factor [Planctomycetes bacterium]|jgi:RNA polymerase sigma-70 factor (ECF subfamily)|nr:sigma-70 family RNA polymerase sigma factor [Planctomycetota bacterium]
MDEGPLDTVLANAGFIRQLAGALARDESEADDVAQDALARALPPPRALAMDLRSWLAGITRNVFRMRRRTEARRLRREQRSARPEELPSAAEQAERLELLGRIAAALVDLDEPYRSTVVLRYHDGYSPPEIARLTDTPLNTVKTRLRRGLARLRDSLDAGRGPRKLRSALLLLAGQPAPRAAPAALTGAASLVLTGALLMSTKFKVVLAVLVVLSLSTVLILAPSGPAGPPPAPAAPGADPVPPAGGEPVGSGTSDAEPATAPDTAAIRAGTGESAAGTTGTVEGRVVDRGGRPVAGLKIQVSGGDHLSVAWLYGLAGGQTVLTDGEGNFRVSGLAGRRARILIRSAEYAHVEMVVAPGGDPVRIRLEPGQAIAGRVVDGATGQGIAGLPVLVRPAGEPRSTPRTVFAEDDGTFRIEGLGEGARALQFGYEVQGGTRDWEDYRIRTVTPVEVGTTDLVVELVRGLRIEGTVLDSEGNPAPARIHVQLTGRTPDGRMDYEFRRYTATREGGVFRFGGLPEGRNHVAIRPETAADPHRGLTITAADAPEVPAGTRDLVIRMARGRAIEGRVENEVGEPLGPPGVLYVFPTGSQVGSPGTVMAIVAADGTFCTSALSDAVTWDVYVTGFAGHGSVVRERVLAGASDLVITLPRTGRITGRVLDAEGRPVTAGVPVLARAEGADPTAEFAITMGATNAEGGFAVECLGEYAYTLRAGAGETNFRVGAPVTGVRPGTEGVELRVEEGIEFSARLLDAGGLPQRTHLIQARRPGDDSFLAHRAAIDNDEGRFTLRGLEPGRLRIWAFFDGANVLLGEFDVPATDVEIRLPPR